MVHTHLDENVYLFGTGMLLTGSAAGRKYCFFWNMSPYNSDNSVILT